MNARKRLAYVPALSLLSFLLTLFLISKAFAISDREPFDIAADAVEFVDASQELIAEGHVVIIQSSATLKADYVHFDRAARRLIARGHVILRDHDQILAGDQLDYDMALQKGLFTEPKGYSSTWLFQGGSWEKHEDYYLGREGSFTSCELPDAHYFFRAKRIHYVPDDRFWAWSNWLNVDGVPVLYLPIVQKPLGPQRVVFQAQPGNDSANGTFARTVTTARYAPRVYQKFLYDYYSDIGNGLGTELNYEPSAQMKGSFFGYYINPKQAPDVPGATSQPQYSLRSYHWQQLNPQMTLQSNINMRKNVSFNNLFYKQDNNQGVNDIFSSIALTHQTKKINQRIVVEADQAPDAGSDPLFAETHMQSASLPRYEFTLYQVPLWAPHKDLPHRATDYAGLQAPARPMILPKPSIGALNFNMGGTAEEFYSRIDQQTRTRAQTNLSLNQSYPLARDITLTPTVNGDVHWQDRSDPVSSGTTPSTTPGTSKGVQALPGTSANLRWRPSSALTFDQNYALSVRLEPNAFALDRGADDGGIQTHHLAWTLYNRATRALLVRSFSGMDLRKIENEDPNAYRQRRIDPWVTEVTVTPYRKSYDYFLRYSLGYYPTRVTSWEASGNYRGPYKSIWTSGLLYNRGTEGQMTWNNKVGLYFSPGWRLDSEVDSSLPAVGQGASHPGKIIASEFILVRDIHCWEIQFIYRNRPPITQEFSFLVNLKLGPRAPKKIADENLETQFYPWRSRAYAN